jgi:hypothetical protein
MKISSFQSWGIIKALFTVYSRFFVYYYFISIQISPSPDCVRALTKMTGCPACQGLPELKACSNYCINVMKGCLAYQAELDADWNNFVGNVLIT